MRGLGEEVGGGGGEAMTLSPTDRANLEAAGVRLIDITIAYESRSLNRRHQCSITLDHEAVVKAGSLSSEAQIILVCVQDDLAPARGSTPPVTG